MAVADVWAPEVVPEAPTTPRHASVHNRRLSRNRPHDQVMLGLDRDLHVVADYARAARIIGAYQA